MRKDPRNPQALRGGIARIAVVLLLAAAAQAQTLQERIDKLYLDCAAADVESLGKLIASMKRDRTVVPYYLEFALPRVADPAARDWVASKGLTHKLECVQLASVVAVGVWKHEGARKTVLELLKKQVKRRHPDAALVYEAARTLRSDEAFETCLQIEGWFALLAAAECLPDELHDGASRVFLCERAVVLETAARNAGRAYVPELKELARTGTPRVRRAAAKSLERLGETVPEHKHPKPATVHFVLDVSSQMKWPDYMPNRMQQAVRECGKAIRSLDHKTRFNVLTFAGHVSWWRKDPVLSTPGNKDEGIRWMESRALPRGAANTHGALMRCGEGADEVYLYSGSIPSTGEYVAYPEILHVLHSWNRLQKVRFHTIAITRHTGKRAKEFAAFMRRIAEMTGGTHEEWLKPYRDGR